MTKEHNFRIWDKGNKRWLYGTLGRWYFDVSLHPDKMVKGVGDELENLDLENWQRCTNLKDKNNKQVYEGDIVICASLNMKCNHVIEWGGPNGMPGWSMSGTIIGPFGEYKWLGKEEIIGNIDENLELLEGIKK